MKIAIISDIHANYEALSSISDKLNDVETILVLGDIIGYYFQVNEVIDYLRDHQAVCVLGNHDYYLLNRCPPQTLPQVILGINYANSVISPENREWLSKIPFLRTMTIGNHSLLLCHGSPWDPLNEYLYPNNPSINQLQYLNYDIISFGHTHREFLSQVNGKTVINPGSVGQSRDQATKSCACAVILDTESMELIKIHQKFDPMPIINLGMKNGSDDGIKKYLI